MIVNPAIYGSGGEEHFTSMPFTAELAALFEPDSLDTANNLWRNKITGGNDMELVGGASTDNACLFGAGEYGHVSSPQFPFSMYLVVKKPEYDNNVYFCGSKTSGSSLEYTFANNGNGKDSLFETIANGGFAPYLFYYYTDQKQKYHVASFTIADNDYYDPSSVSDSGINTAVVHFMVDNVPFGSIPTKKDLTGESGYTNYNETMALNARAVGSKGETIDYSQYAPVKDSYYRAFAFGGKQTLKQMQANHKYLYERYCV